MAGSRGAAPGACAGNTHVDRTARIRRARSCFSEATVLDLYMLVLYSRATQGSLRLLQEEDIDTELTPKQVVAKLDRYIVGQVAGLSQATPQL